MDCSWIEVAEESNELLNWIGDGLDSGSDSYKIENSLTRDTGERLFLGTFQNQIELFNFLRTKKILLA